MNVPVEARSRPARERPPLRDVDCVELLRWALPRLGLHWPGFRRVRRQVCRRVAARLDELGLDGADAYRAYLEETPEEWRRLDGFCRVTISRFHRDRGVFELLAESVLPELARDAAARGSPLRAWSAGCASGEEPYSLVLAWCCSVAALHPSVPFEVLATDVDETLLRRARAASYPASSLRELPDSWRSSAFVRKGDELELRPRYRRHVTFRRHDVRDPAPDGPFDLVLCRNLAFTYFDDTRRRASLARLTSCLRPGGALVIGSHETLPEGAHGLAPWRPGAHVFRWSDPTRGARGWAAVP